MFDAFRFKLLCVLALCLPLLGQSALGAETKARTTLVYGDSLSAAYGIPKEQGWVYLLEKQLVQQTGTHQVVNASISGETTSGGVTRLANLLKQHQPSLVLLQLGANDGLRGLPVKDMRNNLASMIEMSQRAGAKVALIGIMIPPNYGPRYTQEFRETYTQLATRYQLPLVPFLLEGVAGKPELMQEDGLHPTAQAQPILFRNVWEVLAPEFRRKTTAGNH